MSAKKPRAAWSKKPPRETFYKIRDIVAENIEGGRKYYQIDWEDDPETGESYEKTWVGRLPMPPRPRPGPAAYTFRNPRKT